MEAPGDLQFIEGGEAPGEELAVFDLSVDISSGRAPGFIKTVKLLTSRAQRY